MKHLANTPDGDSIILVSGNEIGIIKKYLGHKVTLSTSTLSKVIEYARRHSGDDTITGATVLSVMAAYDEIVPGQMLYYADEDGEPKTIEV